MAPESSVYILYGVYLGTHWTKNRFFVMAESWMKVCAERLKRACHTSTGEGVGEDVAQAWANEMGGVKWTGAQGGLDMQYEEALRDVRGWMGESDCLWLQQRPRHEIEVGPAAGALRRLAGDLGIPLYDFGDDSGSDWDEAGPSRSGRFLEGEDLTGWGHGRRSKRVVRKVDFSAVTDLFGVSALGGVGGGLGVLVRVIPCWHLVHQEQRNVRPVRPDAPGAPGAGTHIIAKSLDMMDVPTEPSPGRNCPSHPPPGVSLLPPIPQAQDSFQSFPSRQTPSYPSPTTRLPYPAFRRFPSVLPLHQSRAHHVLVQ